MARNRIKLAHERELLRLKVQKQQSRIAIADHRDRIAKIDAELARRKVEVKPQSGG